VKRHFMGESVHKVDQKGRVSVPVQFRRKLEADDPDFDRADNPTPAVVLIYGLHGGVCLEGYSMETFGELNESIARQGRFSAERTQLERIVNTKAYFTQVDESGRIVLPQRLREQIGVTDEAYFAGMGARFQIWSPAGYAAEEARMAESLAEPGREQSLLGLLDGAPS
jgi:MraZ protein